ncbi:MAG: 2-hydroxychromene-2-carboxylate isomerase [Pseudomonadota bacterium]
MTDATAATDDGHGDGVTVDYYISLNSPWTYLGAQRFLDLANTYGAKIKTKPARFADVFSATGGLPLGKRSAQRQAYRMMELRRWRRRLDTQIVLEPEHFPSDETAGVRLVIAAEVAGLDSARLSLEIGRELWERDHAIAEAAALRTACARAEIDYDALQGGAPEDGDLDDIWEQNTEEAISAGVFGAPSYVFPDGEIMWGQDRLGFVEEKLKALAA